MSGRYLDEHRLLPGHRRAQSPALRMTEESFGVMRRDAMLLVGDGGFNKLHGRKKKIKWGSRRTCRALLISGCPCRPRIMLKAGSIECFFFTSFHGLLWVECLHVFRFRNEYKSIGAEY